MSNGKGEYDVTGWMTPIVRCRLFLEWIVVSSVVGVVVVVVFYTHRETPRSRADCLDEKRDDDGSGFSALEVVIIEKQTQDRGLRELREGKGGT